MKVVEQKYDDDEGREKKGQDFKIHYRLSSKFVMISIPINVFPFVNSHFINSLTATYILDTAIFTSNTRIL